jgi:hypothetical protein
VDPINKTIRKRVIGQSIQFDAITYEPQLQLLKRQLASRLELPHPSAIGSRVRNIDYDLREIVAIQYTTVPPISFDALLSKLAAPK